jgi:aminoglycoside phosphotransferase (APT) family kinase protein
MSEIPPWGADRDLDLPGAQAAVEEAFPDLEVGELQFLGSGWDFDTVGLGLRWVARFPRRAEVAAGLEMEVQVMPTLSLALMRLGIEVPDLHGVAPETAAFPYPFLVQRRIWGLPLESVGPTRFAIRLAAHLGEAICAVHALEAPAGIAQAQGDEDEWLDHAVTAVKGLSPALRNRVPRAVAWVEGSPEVPGAYSGPPRLLHNDLSPHHVRVARTGLGVIGILDWTDIAAGDPARDFATLYSWGGPDILNNMLPRYSLELGAGFEERVVFMARVGSIAWLRDLEARDGESEEELAKHITWTVNAFSSN